MFRKFFAVMMSVVFAVCMCGLALAGDNANVNQKGTDNEAYITQVWNNSANANAIDIDQIAGTTNDATAKQNGNWNDIDVTQTATAGLNNLYVEQKAADGSAVYKNDLDISQTAGTYNKATVYEWGLSNTANATQKATAASNDLYVKQEGNTNNLGLSQTAGTYNKATVYELGGENKANVSQGAATSNDLYVKQDGNYNKLVGAYSLNGSVDAVIWEGAAATQISGTSYNDLNVVQGGASNEVGLAQNAGGLNYADIDQYNGGNSLVAWQYAPTGSNSLTSYQAGSKVAIVTQYATANNNVASVDQR